MQEGARKKGKKMAQEEHLTRHECGFPARKHAKLRSTEAAQEKKIKNNALVHLAGTRKCLRGAEGSGWERIL